MTYSKEITLWCDGDGCDEWSQFSGARTVKGAVRIARGNNWTSPEWDEHYCPDCSHNADTE